MTALSRTFYKEASLSRDGDAQSANDVQSQPRRFSLVMPTGGQPGPHTTDSRSTQTMPTDDFVVYGDRKLHKTSMQLLFEEKRVVSLNQKQIECRSPYEALTGEISMTIISREYRQGCKLADLW